VKIQYKAPGQYYHVGTDSPPYYKGPYSTYDEALKAAGDDYTSIYDHWTDSFSPNYGFITRLFELSHKYISNAQAYQIYIEKHMQTRSYSDDTYWQKMNVRNQLCKLVHLSVLQRTAPGQYRWYWYLDTYTTERLLEVIKARQAATLVLKKAAKARYEAAEAALNAMLDARDGTHQAFPWKESHELRSH